MKRISILALIVAAAVLLIVPGVVGWVVERNYQGLIDNSAATGGRYDRGWFASDSRLDIEPANAYLQQLAALATGEYHGRASLQLTSKVRHGPLPALRSGSLQPGWTEAVSQLSLISPTGRRIELPGTIDSRIETGGNSLFLYNSPSGRASLPALELDWQPVRFELQLSRDAASATFAGRAEGVTIYDDDAAISLSALSVAGQQTGGPGELWYGKTTWQLGSLSFPGYAIQDLTITTDVDPGQDWPVVNLQVSVATLASNLFAGDNALVDLQLERIDGHAMASLLETIAKQKGVNLDDAIVFEALRKLFVAGPTITVKEFLLPMNNSALEGHATMIVAPGMDLNAPGALATGIDGQATVLVPQKLVRLMLRNSPANLASAVDAMISLGLLRAEGNRYRIEVALADGLLVVNGVPIPLPF